MSNIIRKPPGPPGPRNRIRASVTSNKEPFIHTPDKNLKMGVLHILHRINWDAGSFHYIAHKINFFRNESGEPRGEVIRKKPYFFGQQTSSQMVSPDFKERVKNYLKEGFMNVKKADQPGRQNIQAPRGGDARNVLEITQSLFKSHLFHAIIHDAATYNGGKKYQPNLLPHQTLQHNLQATRSNQLTKNSRVFDGPELDRRFFLGSFKYITDYDPIRAWAHRKRLGKPDFIKTKEERAREFELKKQHTPLANTVFVFADNMASHDNPTGLQLTHPLEEEDGSDEWGPRYRSLVPAEQQAGKIIQHGVKSNLAGDSGENLYGGGLYSLNRDRLINFLEKKRGFKVQKFPRSVEYNGSNLTRATFIPFHGGIDNKIRHYNRNFDNRFGKSRNIQNGPGKKVIEGGPGDGVFPDPDKDGPKGYD